MKKEEAKVIKASAKLAAMKAAAAKDHFAGFKKFIKDQGLVGMAIGLILGTAAGTLVKSLIDNIIMPPLGFILGSAEGLKGLSWTMGKTAAGKDAVLNYGIFLNDVVNFLVIAVVVYFVLMGVEKLFTDNEEEK